jgi:hypothetical protein
MQWKSTHKVATNVSLMSSFITRRFQPLPNIRALKFCLAETSNSASQLEVAHLAASVESFPENDDIVEQSACQLADGGTRQYSRPFQPKH